MKTLSKNDFVQWTGTDEDGKFSHVGQVVSHTEDSIEFVTQHGTMNVPTTDGHFRQISKPQDWNVSLPKETKKKTTTTINKPTQKKVVAGSKKEKALDIYKKMMDNGNHPKRADVIKQFIDELQMTKAGASTYQNTCKKHFS